MIASGVRPRRTRWPRVLPLYLADLVAAVVVTAIYVEFSYAETAEERCCPRLR
ncbi:hypothetical protein [Amycolatopsis sp. NPDC051102]|uniref:hypothetical protein n=1 Tax=Amycolatopsis sp. NPDC051102 TaxID=3155163 RepID=UPI003423EF11